MLFIAAFAVAHFAGRRQGPLLLTAIGPFPSAAALLDAIEAAVLGHAAGADQADDVTLLAVRRASVG
jgi:hypothetical protein